MPIRSTNDFIAAVSEDKPRKASFGWAGQDWDKPVQWGPATSLDAGDAASRMGIDMGEPSIKAAALMRRERGDTEAMVKEAFVGGLLAKGVSRLAPKVLSGATSLGKGLGNVAAKTPGALGRGGQSAWQGGKKVLNAMEHQMPRGGWADRLTGIGGDVVTTGNDLHNALTFNF